MQVYKWNGTASRWDPLGDPIRGEAIGDYFGHSVALSANGDIVAIGARQSFGAAHDAGDNSGHVRVYKWNGNNWDKLGDIDGEAGDESGFSVSLSSDGSTVAIGAFYNNEGRVRVYRLPHPPSAPPLPPPLSPPPPSPPPPSPLISQSHNSISKVIKLILKSFFFWT